MSRLGPRLQVTAIGLLGVLAALVITESALVGLRNVHSSDDAVTLISKVQLTYQDADTQHDALRADLINALLISDSLSAENAVLIRDDIRWHIAGMRTGLDKIAALPLTGPAGEALDGLEEPLRGYAVAATRLADVALADPSKAAAALKDFDASFGQLEQAHALVAERVAAAAEQTRERADRSLASARQRILLASLVSLVGLVLLTGTQLRLGRDLSRLMSQQRGVAEALQQSLLPDRLPDLPGISLAARYLPGAAGVEVGGDWYDVIELPSREIGLVMGDVVGHDLRAASVMGQMRNALRAYALEGLAPSLVLSRLNDFVRRTGQDEMVTCIYAIFDPEAATLLLSNAGHLPPLLIGPDRDSVFLEHGPSPPIGGLPETAYAEKLYHVGAGSTVLLYTDGLVERRGEAVDVSLERLRRTVAGGPTDIDDLCAHLLDPQQSAGVGLDDVALLAVRAQPTLDARLHLTVPAVGTALAAMRQTFARWLTEAGATPEETFELTVACCEAASNAVGHAYGPGHATFDVTATVTGRDVEVTVSDCGVWRPSRANGENRGRGLETIKALTDTMTIDRSARGTTVRMRRQLVGPPRFDLWPGIV